MATATATELASSVPAAQRVVLRGVRWETYEALLADHLDRSVPHFAFDRGVLEIVSPSTPHEEDNRTLALLVEIIAEELDIDVRNVGSMTFKREDLQRGFEPDSSFYIQHEPQVSDRTQIDLTVDPPPDLVIEVEASRSAIDKLALFASMSIPEVWRMDGESVVIHLLDGERYANAEASRAVPVLTTEVLTRLLGLSRTLPSPEWFRAVTERALAQRLPTEPEP